MYTSVHTESGGGARKRRSTSPNGAYWSTDCIAISVFRHTRCILLPLTIRRLSTLGTSPEDRQSKRSKSYIWSTYGRLCEVCWRSSYKLAAGRKCTYSSINTTFFFGHSCWCHTKHTREPPCTARSCHRLRESGTVMKCLCGTTYPQLFSSEQPRPPSPVGDQEVPRLPVCRQCWHLACLFLRLARKKTSN